MVSDRITSQAILPRYFVWREFFMRFVTIVASSCWNHILCNILLSNAGNKKLVIMSRLRPIAVHDKKMRFPCLDHILFHSSNTCGRTTSARTQRCCHVLYGLRIHLFLHICWLRWPAMLTKQPLSKNVSCVVQQCNAPWLHFPKLVDVNSQKTKLTYIFFRHQAVFCV